MAYTKWGCAASSTSAPMRWSASARCMMAAAGTLHTCTSSQPQVLACLYAVLIPCNTHAYTGECKAIHGEFDRAGADLQALGKCRLAVCKNLPRGTTAPTTARPTLAPTTLAPTSRSTATPSHAGTPVPSSPVELAGLSENCAQTIDGGGWQLVRHARLHSLANLHAGLQALAVRLVQGDRLARGHRRLWRRICCG